jgi:hypothetical protein
MKMRLEFIQKDWESKELNFQIELFTLREKKRFFRGKLKSKNRILRNQFIKIQKDGQKEKNQI